MSNYIIDIHMINRKGFIWNSNDWYVLRTTHRLLGSLIGTLPSSPRQEDQNGLPCLLLPEEVRLLVENGIGHVVDYPSFVSLPNEHSVILKNNQEQKHLNEIKKEFALKKADSISNLVVSAILADGDKNCKEVVKLNREVCKIKPFDTSLYAIILLDEQCSKVIELPLPEFTTDLQRLRYKVFKDLWSKGYYLSCGMKFGGDFLVYEGDPLAYHAKYIVNCRDLDQQIMVSRSRVSSITNKKMVVAKDDGDSIKYLIYSLDGLSTCSFSEKPIKFFIQ